MWTPARTCCAPSLVFISEHLRVKASPWKKPRAACGGGGLVLCFSSPFSVFLEEGVVSTAQGSRVWEMFLWEPMSLPGRRRGGPGLGDEGGWV